MHLARVLNDAKEENPTFGHQNSHFVCAEHDCFQNGYFLELD